MSTINSSTRVPSRDHYGRGISVSCALWIVSGFFPEVRDVSGCTASLCRSTHLGIFLKRASISERSLRQQLSWMHNLYRHRLTLTDKINFNPRKADQINALHERVANRLRWVIDTNQGLYLKLGQALGLQAALLPKPYREAFGHVFDRAPSVSYQEVVKVFMDDLGVRPEDLFEEFSKEPLASASIAQVHKARLKGSGTEVAVKVQKPAIRKQMEWDLFSYRSLMWLAERIFDMPSESYILPEIGTLSGNDSSPWLDAPLARRR